MHFPKNCSTCIHLDLAYGYEDFEIFHECSKNLSFKDVEESYYSEIDINCPCWELNPDELKYYEN